MSPTVRAILGAALGGLAWQVDPVLGVVVAAPFAVWVLSGLLGLGRGRSGRVDAASQVRMREVRDGVEREIVVTDRVSLPLSALASAAPPEPPAIEPASPRPPAPPPGRRCWRCDRMMAASRTICDCGVRLDFESPARAGESDRYCWSCDCRIGETTRICPRCGTEL